MNANDDTKTFDFERDYDRRDLRELSRNDRRDLRELSRNDRRDLRELNA